MYMIPTNEELRAFISQIAVFFQMFVDLFEQVKVGLTQTFAGYKSAYEETSEENLPL